MARDLLVHDPPRVLAWRFLHDPRLAAVPAWLAPLLPRPSEALDRDPVALLLGAIAAGVAVLYLIAALRGAGARLRGALVVLAAAALVVAPTAAFIALGNATGRPYGQDGGVVQLPLALDRLLVGESPYGADYSDSILGKEARVSDFWTPYGGNPILHHHAYLPGTHLLMLPLYLLGRAGMIAFDPRQVTLLAWGLAVLLAVRLGSDAQRRLAAAAVVALNPLVYWHMVFGANDVIVVALVLLSVFLAEARRPRLAAAALGLACAAKQLAWPFAPFLLLHLSGARSFGDLRRRDTLRRLSGPCMVAALVFLAVVGPVAALDFRRFWGDIVVYNVGLPGADNYPLGGTPGFGFANLLIYFGAVSSLRDHVPFGWFYIVLIPLGLVLLRRQMREGSSAMVLVTGSTALLASLYLSRVVHPNYLILPAILLPIGLLRGARLPADVAAVPLLLLAVAAEVADHQVFRATWEDGLGVHLPRHLTGLSAALAPRAGPALTPDPLGAAISAAAAGLAIVLLVAGVLGASWRLRLGVVAVALLAVVVAPSLAVVNVGQATGQARGQDPWMARVLSEAHGFSGGHVRPPLQAWSTSFRRDPPGPLLDAAETGRACDRLLGGILGRLRLFDPRRLSLVGLVLVSGLLAALARAEMRPLVVGASLLSPLVAVDLPFGSSDVLLLAVALAAWMLSRAAWTLGAALAIGVASAFLPRGLFLLPWVLGPIHGTTRRRALAGALAGFVVPVVVAAGWVDPRAFAAGLLTQPSEPGLGLPNVVSYWGAEGGAPALRLLPWVVGGLGFLAGLRAGASGARALAWAAALLLAGLWVTPGASPHDLAVPMTLLLLGSALDGQSTAAQARPDPRRLAHTAAERAAA